MRLSLLPPNISVYGGFSGTERFARTDVSSNITILSDIDCRGNCPIIAIM